MSDVILILPGFELSAREAVTALAPTVRPFCSVGPLLKKGGPNERQEVGVFVRMLFGTERKGLQRLTTSAFGPFVRIKLSSWRSGLFGLFPNA
jgi:hypothetical protein